jgi:hypothetical protein
MSKLLLSISEVLPSVAERTVVKNPDACAKYRLEQTQNAGGQGDSQGPSAGAALIEGRLEKEQLSLTARHDLERAEPTTANRSSPSTPSCLPTRRSCNQSR